MAILDTPGFDDTHKTDADVLQGIANFLANTYRKNIKLNGLIYLHRIIDPRLGHQGLNNLGLFRALCGDDPLRKVVLATTFWEEMTNKQRAQAREEDLRTNPEYWADMLAKGASMTQFHNTQESALQTIGSLLDNEDKIVLKIQKEMVNDGLDLIDTTAGEALKQELTAKIEKYERDIENLRREHIEARKARDKEMEEIKAIATQRALETKREFQSQIGRLESQNREHLRQQGMDFDMRFLALRKQEKVGDSSTRMFPDSTPTDCTQLEPDEVSQEKPLADATTESSHNSSIAEKPQTASGKASPQELLEKKKAKREKILQILGAVGTTATAAGVSVINPIAIPIAFSGLIGLINACFSSRDKRKMEALREQSASDSAELP